MPSFGPLIGIVYISNSHCRFLIYSTKNAEVLTFHEMELRQIVPKAGWLEYDADEIWRLTKECIETACKNLVILEINPSDIVAVSICNQRGTTVVWDKGTGATLHNAIGWTDSRCLELLQIYLSKVKYNRNYLRSRSGLPLSTCFAAFKLKWLKDTVPLVTDAMANDTCNSGTLDSWILWNLTGGTDYGVHCTDVTNAAYTSLMNIHTLQWDPWLCKFFGLSLDMLPRIRSNSEVYGFVRGGALHGLPIAGVIGDQPATLLGQLATHGGQTVCNIDESCFVLLNTGNELMESEKGLISTVAYKLGEDANVCYALEGAISNAGSTVNWLTNNLRISTEINSNESQAAEVLTNFFSESSMLSSSCSSNLLNGDLGWTVRRSEITLVPAFHGLYAPYWRHDARGLILGVTSQTTAEHVTQAAFESTGFQIHEILEAFKSDAPQLVTTMQNCNKGSKKHCLTLGGKFAENTTFMQFVADIVGCLLEKPETTSPAGLGAMIVGGITMNVVSLVQAEVMYKPPADVITPMISPNRRDLLYKRWEYAVRRCLDWNNYETFEADLSLFTQRERDTNYSIRRSLPGSIFFATTFMVIVVAEFLKNQKALT